MLSRAEGVWDTFDISRSAKSRDGDFNISTLIMLQSIETIKTCSSVLLGCVRIYLHQESCGGDVLAVTS